MISLGWICSINPTPWQQSSKIWVGTNDLQFQVIQYTMTCNKASSFRLRTRDLARIQLESARHVSISDLLTPNKACILMLDLKTWSSASATIKNSSTATTHSVIPKSTTDA